MALPIIPIAAGAAGLWYLWPETCEHSAVKLRWSEFSSLIKQLTEQLKRASGSAPAVLVSRVNALALRVAELEGLMKQVEASTTQTLGKSTVACRARDAMDSVQTEASAVSTEIGKLLGEESVVPPPPTPPWPWYKKLAVVAAVAGGGYLAYRWYQSGDHGGNIPRNRLPRYAGGTRRSS